MSNKYIIFDIKKFNNSLLKEYFKKQKVLNGYSMHSKRPQMQAQATIPSKPLNFKRRRMKKSGVQDTQKSFLLK